MQLLSPYVSMLAMKGDMSRGGSRGVLGGALAPPKIPIAPLQHPQEFLGKKSPKTQFFDKPQLCQFCMNFFVLKICVILKYQCFICCIVPVFRPSLQNAIKQIANKIRKLDIIGPAVSMSYPLTDTSILTYTVHHLNCRQVCFAVELVNELNCRQFCFAVELHQYTVYCIHSAPMNHGQTLQSLSACLPLFGGMGTQKWHQNKKRIAIFFSARPVRGF